MYILLISVGYNSVGYNATFTFGPQTSMVTCTMYSYVQLSYMITFNKLFC